MAAAITADDDSQIPTLLALPSSAATSASSSRRLPPPCWTPEETVALIDAYRDKWYSLRRGNLRANHWQEVADDVASRCPAISPKTAVQCRHKMEKLRKRYRGEIQRAAGLRRHTASGWAHFQNMHAMETGISSPPPPPPPHSSTSSDDEESDDHNTTAAAAVNQINNLFNRNSQRSFDSGAAVKIPKFPQIGQNPNPRFPNSIPIPFPTPPPGKVFREGYSGTPQKWKSAINNSLKRVSSGSNSSSINDAVSAIQALGEGFIRIEKMKMEMLQQMEVTRMEMELKRTEMILDAQHRIVEAFANAVSERSPKRAKKKTTTTTSTHCWN